MSFSQEDGLRRAILMLCESHSCFGSQSGISVSLIVVELCCGHSGKMEERRKLITSERLEYFLPPLCLGISA